MPKPRNNREARFFPIGRNQSLAVIACRIFAKWGMSVGSNVVSHHRAIFSRKLEIVGRSEPTYRSSASEVRWAVYDHFAALVVKKRVTLSPAMTKTLQERLAKLAPEQIAVVRFFSRPNPADEQTDQHVAARAAVIIEALADISEANTNEFRSVPARSFPMAIRA